MEKCSERQKRKEEAYAEAGCSGRRNPAVSAP